MAWRGARSARPHARKRRNPPSPYRDLCITQFRPAIPLEVRSELRRSGSAAGSYAKVSYKGRGRCGPAEGVLRSGRGAPRLHGSPAPRHSRVGGNLPIGRARKRRIPLSLEGERTPRTWRERVLEAPRRTATAPPYDIRHPRVGAAVGALPAPVTPRARPAPAPSVRPRLPPGAVLPQPRHDVRVEAKRHQRLADGTAALLLPRKPPRVRELQSPGASGRNPPPSTPDCPGRGRCPRLSPRLPQA